MATRKTTTKKPAKAAPKRARKPAPKVSRPRGAGKATDTAAFGAPTLNRAAAQRLIQRLIDGGHIKPVNIGQVHPFSLFEDSPKAADRETGFATRVTDAYGNTREFIFPSVDLPSCDDMRRRLEEDCTRQQATTRKQEPNHLDDAYRYGGQIAAMAATAKPASGLRTELNRQDANIASLHSSLDELVAALDPVLAPDVEAASPIGSGVDIDPPTEFERTVRDHADQIAYSTRRIQKILRRLSL